jgi:hypothetical protein
MPIYDFHIPDLEVHDHLELANAGPARDYAEQLGEGIATVPV